MLPGFEEGAFTVQDISSVLAVEAAQLQETDLVMDICAAPGGKSILAAEKARCVIARDVSERKTNVIEENIRRMRAKNVEVQVFDATEFDAKYEEKADAVLMDVPCSGLGVMGKKRDIKYHVTPEGLESLMAVQRRIVDNSWRYVKPGGILIYSTCTIHSGENEAMVKYICEELPFEPVSLENAIPRALWEQKQAMEARIQQNMKVCQGEQPRSGSCALQGEQPQSGSCVRQGVHTQEEAGIQLTEKEQASCIQLLPGYMECDGFFFAKFRRK